MRQKLLNIAKTQGYGLVKEAEQEYGLTVENIEQFMLGAAKYNDRPVDMETATKHYVINRGLPPNAGPRYVHKLLAKYKDFGSLVVFRDNGRVFKTSLVTTELMNISVDKDGIVTLPSVDEDKLEALRSATELLAGCVLGCELLHFILVQVSDRRKDATHEHYTSVSVVGDYFEREKKIMTWQLVPPHHGIDPKILKVLQPSAQDD